MSLLDQVTPINLREEKEKFFSDPNYNPQFIYEKNPPQKILEKYGKPNKKYFDLAQTIVDKAYAQNTETELRLLRGKPVPKEKVYQKINTFLKMHNLDDRYKIVSSNSFVARTTLDQQYIKLREPVDFGEKDLLGMIYHEIGTHALRRVNYEQQPWFKKKKKYGFKNYLKTEEGLAALHSLLPLKFKLAYQSALNYLAVDYAQKYSFSELYQFLNSYIDDPQRRFVFTFRKKRGLVDTSHPGGFTKDLVYFEGIVEVWRYLKQNNFNITQLYFGKMALEDVDKAVKINPGFEPLLPSFFITDKVKYEENLAEIGKLNFLI